MRCPPDGTVPRLTLRIGEAAEALAISPRALYPLMRSGAIRVLRFGRSVRISVVELERYVTEQTETQALDAKLYPYNDEAVRALVGERRGEASPPTPGAHPQMASGGTAQGVRSRRPRLAHTRARPGAVREATARTPS